jgi:putative flippase GtrA
MNQHAALPPLSRRLGWFLVSGGVATTLHALVAMTCIHGLSWGTALANGTAFLIASLASYWINTHLGAKRPHTAEIFLRFMSVTLVCAAIASQAARLAHGWGLHDILVILFVSAVMPPLTFTLHTLWTYRHDR